MRLLALTFALALALPVQAATPSQRLADLATRYYDAQSRFDPLTATGSGDNRFDDQLALALAPAERARRFAAYRGFLKELATVPATALPAGERLTRELLENS
ncbi:MAG: DUF885 domain-containing protein, partial [Rubrivivax sp.]